MKEKNLQPRLLYPARISFRFGGEIKSFTNKQKLKVQYHQTSYIRNVKGTFLSEKEKVTTRNMKIMKGKTSPIKEINYTVKVVNQPCTKLVGRLKEKSSKIIYICNK